MERIRKFENLHILFWLGKDISWCLEWRLMGILMIVPTITLAILITYITRHTRREKYYNIAVCFWIAANNFCRINTTIVQFDDYFLSITDHMRVGHDIAIITNDHPGPLSLSDDGLAR